MIHEATMLALIAEAESLGTPDIMRTLVSVARDYGHSAVSDSHEAFIDCMDADRGGGETWVVRLDQGLPEPEYMQRFIYHHHEVVRHCSMAGMSLSVLNHK